MISNKLVNLIKDDMGAQAFYDAMQKEFYFQSIAERRKIRSDLEGTYKSFINEFLKNNPNSKEAWNVGFRNLQIFKLTASTISDFKDGLTKLSQKKITDLTQ